MISVELIIAVLGVLGTIVGALAYIAKRKTDSALETARAGRIAAETELQEAKSESTRFEQMMAFMSEQLRMNQAHQESLKLTEQRNEDNYQTLKRLSDRHFAEMTLAAQANRREFVEKLDELPDVIHAKTMESVRLIFAEMSVTLAELVREATGMRDMIPFPTFRDSRWHQKRIQPKNGVACVFDQPRYAEPAKNITPEGCIKDAETVWIIQGAAGGFHAVRRENGIYGWLLEAAVEVITDGEAIDHAASGSRGADAERSDDSDGVPRSERPATAGAGGPERTAASGPGENPTANGGPAR
ncbi:MAG: hypothetical protein K8L99_26210 [Anaerolineae bacterium]|nr:hypothetical protein [Anaerolineae bacterium]